MNQGKRKGLLPECVALGWNQEVQTALQALKSDK